MLEIEVSIIPRILEILEIQAFLSLELLEIWEILFFRCPGILEILEHEVPNILQNPGNLTQTQNPIQNPNLYPFLDPGRVIPGNTGGPGPGRRAGSQHPNPLGGCAPQTPARVSSGRSGVQRYICLSSYFIIPHPASYVFNVRFVNLVDPVVAVYIFVKLYAFVLPFREAC